MARTIIELPSSFTFTTVIPVRITDINYGNHVGNDAILSLIHEARMQYLRHLGYTELNFAGVGMIMKDAALEFKAELFYGDSVLVSVAAGEFTSAGFEIIYKLEKKVGDKTIPVVYAKTGMVCYDYEKKKVVALPQVAREKIEDKR